MLFNEVQYKDTVKCLKISVNGTLEDYYPCSNGHIDFDTEVKPRIERVAALESAHVAYHRAIKQDASLRQIAESAHTVAECRNWLINEDNNSRPELVALLDTMLADICEILYKKTRISEPVSQYDQLFDD